MDCRTRDDLVATCEEPVLLGEMEHVESVLEQLREVYRGLLSKVAFFENKADKERNMAEKETGEEKTERIAQAKAVRKRIKANDKLSEGLQLNRLKSRNRCEKPDVQGGPSSPGRHTAFARSLTNEKCVVSRRVWRTRRL